MGDAKEVDLSVLLVCACHNVNLNTADVRNLEWSQSINTRAGQYIQMFGVYQEVTGIRVFVCMHCGGREGVQLQKRSKVKETSYYIETFPYSPIQTSI